MTSKLTVAQIRGILLDIEGTTTPVSFVHKTLFSYARAELNDYLVANWDSPELVADMAKLREEHTVDVERNLKPPAITGTGRELINPVIAYTNWLMDQDRKSTALKSLQGKIWKEGYLSGTLKAEIFADVAPALKRWHKAGLSINIFSSGSRLAQQLLFAHTIAGDLSGLFNNYYDTTTGPKAESESYQRIAESLQLPARDILFISDVTAELAAASRAGMRTLLCVRPGNAPAEDSEQFESINSFDGLF